MKKIAKFFGIITIIVIFALLMAACKNNTSSTSLDEEEEDNKPPVDLPVGGTGNPSTSWYTANSSAAVFHIKDADELAGLAELVNRKVNPVDFYSKTIILDENLELSAYGKNKSFNHGNGWIPIGNTKPPKHSFKGIFEGNNKSISGLYVNIDDGDIDAGLFGFVETAIIKDLKLLDVDVNSIECAGCLVGDSDFSIISNCSAEGKVNSKAETGGLAGYFNYSEMSGCYAEVTVTIASNVSIAYDAGGLVGYARYSTITSCYATGTVSGYDTIGGLVGHAESSSIINSYATGKVNADDYDAGGLVGRSYSTSISKCYATGAVSSDNFAGGLVGEIDHDCEINRSYATGNVKGRDFYSIGGFAGSVSYSEMQDCYATGTVSGGHETGGLVGTADFATIIKCYATGAVSSEENGGGIVGYVFGGVVEQCFALNPSITPMNGSIENTFDRVAGYDHDGNCGYNLAYMNMDLQILPSSDSVHGNDRSITAIKERSTYNTIFFKWDFGGVNPWKWDASYPIPVLSWQEPSSYPPLPEYLR